MTTTNATLAGAVKTAIEGLGLGITAYRDEAPLTDSAGNPLPLPFCVVTDGLSDSPRRTGDNRAKRTSELVQVDVYEYIKTPNGQRGESYSLAKVIERGLTTIKLSTAPELVWRCNVFSRSRSRDKEANEGLGEVRNIITLQVIRNL